jgi:hypothetical protein
MWLPMGSISFVACPMYCGSCVRCGSCSGVEIQMKSGFNPDSIQIQSRFNPDSIQIQSRFNPDSIQIQSRFNPDPSIRIRESVAVCMIF